MHIHLNPLGGMAGDMFAAAMLDYRPELATGLHRALELAGLTRRVRVGHIAYGDGVLNGSRFEVSPADGAEPDSGHRSYREVRGILRDADLAPEVARRALAIFRLLGDAESVVHGVGLEDVTFHELGAWDALADVVSAAWLIESVEASGWSCGPLPLGRGRVDTEHGQLPVPAPAVARLLEGFVFEDDGRDGERVTPTGAAILRHLTPEQNAGLVPSRLVGSGTGFGTRRLPGISNILRVLAFEGVADASSDEWLAECAFEVDDQTPEDLSAGLERLRAHSDVLDVFQFPVYGKKGRLAMGVRVLTRPGCVQPVVAACLNETATLGVRHQLVQRKALERSTVHVSIGRNDVRVKWVQRPDGSVTGKAEMDDLAGEDRGYAERERLRRSTEAEALGTTGGDEPGD